jgi:hypothetical protein
VAFWGSGSGLAVTKASSKVPSMICAYPQNTCACPASRLPRGQFAAFCFVLATMRTKSPYEAMATHLPAQVRRVGAQATPAGARSSARAACCSNAAIAGSRRMSTSAAASPPALLPHRAQSASKRNSATEPGGADCHFCGPSSVEITPPERS